MNNLKRTEEALRYLNEQGISVRQAERMMGLSTGALRVRNGSISPKLLDKIFELRGADKMGADKNVTTKQSLRPSENDEGADKSHNAEIPKGDNSDESKLKYGNYTPAFKDGILRFRDGKTGLWKRYYDWAVHGHEKDGTPKFKKGMALTGEVSDDGKYTFMENGVKVYFNEAEKDD